MAMARLRVSLTERQRRELGAALRRAPDARTYLRMKVVQLSDRGATVQELAALFDMHEQSVRRVLRAYARGGLAALPDAPRPGRPRKLPPEFCRGDGGGREAWQRVLDRRPAAIPELDTAAHGWTLRLLARYMRVVHRVEVAESTIYAALSRAGLRLGGTRLPLPESEYELTRQRVEARRRGPVGRDGWRPAAAALRIRR